MKALDRVARLMRKVAPNRTADRIDEATAAVREAERAVDAAIEDPALVAQVAARLKVNTTPEVAEDLEKIRKRLVMIATGRPHQERLTTG